MAGGTWVLSRAGQLKTAINNNKTQMRPLWTEARTMRQTDANTNEIHPFILAPYALYSTQWCACCVCALFIFSLYILCLNGAGSRYVCILCVGRSWLAYFHVDLRDKSMLATWVTDDLSLHFDAKMDNTTFHIIQHFEHTYYYFWMHVCVYVCACVGLSKIRFLYKLLNIYFVVNPVFRYILLTNIIKKLQDKETLYVTYLIHILGSRT